MSEEDQIRMLDDLNQEGINRILISNSSTNHICIFGVPSWTTIPYRVDQELPKYNFFTACKLVKE